MNIWFSYYFKFEHIQLTRLNLYVRMFHLLLCGGSWKNCKCDQQTHPHPQGVWIPCPRRIVFQILVVQLLECTCKCANLISNLHVHRTKIELKLLTIIFSKVDIRYIFFQLNATLSNFSIPFTFDKDSFIPGRSWVNKKINS